MKRRSRAHPEQENTRSSTELHERSSDPTAAAAKDVADVIREERSRGHRRPIDTQERRLQRERRNAIVKIFQYGSKEQQRAALRAAGCFSEDEIPEILRKFTTLREQDG